MVVRSKTLFIAIFAASACNKEANLEIRHSPETKVTLKNELEIETLWSSIPRGAFPDGLWDLSPDEEKGVTQRLRIERVPGSVDRFNLFLIKKVGSQFLKFQLEVQIKNLEKPTLNIPENYCVARVLEGQTAQIKIMAGDYPLYRAEDHVSFYGFLGSPVQK
jgi:hypothetical protein